MLAGCGDGQEQTTSESRVTVEDVKEEAAETIDKAQAYTQQQKEEYQMKVAEQLKALDSKMDGLEAEAETLQGDVRTQYERMLVTLKQKRREADEIYTELNQETGEAWSAVKIRMDNMIRNLKAAFGQVASHPS
jgi:hypothetical protein